MTAARFTGWRKLPINPLELSLDTTLRSGQSFRWKKVRGDEWSIALHGRLISLKQDPTHLHYRTATKSSSADSLLTVESLSDDTETELLLRRYLNLTSDLAALYEKWSSVDPNFKKRAPKFTGVGNFWENFRPLQNVSRVGHIDGQAFHDFPIPESLTGPGVEAHLRALGFGYRAKYIAKTALIVAKERPENWLQGLSNPGCFEINTDQKDFPESGREGYREAHEQLLQLQGVGPKVADCVCLMGLGWGESVPVDTHVWQIAQRDYKFGKGKHKSLTKATYDAVGDYFRNLWGQEAGWAHSVLFSAELKTFAERPTKIKVDAQELKVKEEDGSILKSKVIVKREYPVDEVNTEFEKEIVITETSRGQRAKRRKL
ncbi:hypothetical protein B7494_g1512 [Chlorociboria aeruginascens]|nr:hypothetical protein B7494_g1512 [Chlorociboria aeruginascens]